MDLSGSILVVQNFAETILQTDPKDLECQFASDVATDAVNSKPLATVTERILLRKCCFSSADDSYWLSELERLDVNASICTEKGCFSITLVGAAVVLADLHHRTTGMRGQCAPHALASSDSDHLCQRGSFILSCKTTSPENTLNSCTHCYDCGRNPF